MVQEVAGFDDVIEPSNGDFRPTLARELRAWQRDRNQAATSIRWQFTTTDARVKLIKLYPSTHG